MFPQRWQRVDDPERMLDFVGWVPRYANQWERSGDTALFRYDIVEHGDGTYHWEMREAAPDGRIYTWRPVE
jgi:hypothetical protein